MEITISNLKKQFGEKVAVDIPEFKINNGDLLGLVGNNGAGKTTLFRMLLDLLQADDGEAIMKFDSIDEPINPAKSETWKDFTGSYIDEAFLIDFLTPEEYFQFVGHANSMTQAEIDERLADFESFMQGEVMGQKKLIRDFSAGNKQKIGIIAALLSRPQLLILDEPFNFLDPSAQIVLKRLITEYHQTTGATIIISSHNLQHTVDISTRVALLELGHIVKDLPNTNGSAEQELEDYFSVN